MDNKLYVFQNRILKTALKIKNGDENYYLSNDEKLIFGIKKYAYNSEYIIRREITSGDYDSELDAYPITLSSDETNISPGTYYYDAALQRNNGQLEKIIGCTELEIVRSVVRSDSE